ncbi:hypothetical protein HDK77DRAFT_486285 [Phyllosticta capitalensis]|uniref:PWI domain-containing protein n=1 Tax=Phyllosticta capitalensis TaxID=121624 RepID=A0ABR1YCU7_9PEZI
MSSSPPAPKRRFMPEPVETTTKSSRRFAPEPVETTQKSSRKFAPEPVETTAKSTRKFAVQPVETTAKSSRRFAPEPVETTARSSRDQPAAEPPTKKKFAPQPVETTTRSNRNNRVANGTSSSHVASAGSSSSAAGAQATPQIDVDSPQAESRPRRKFAPQLIETAKRSRKAGDVGPTINEADRTEATPDDGGVRTPTRRPRPCPLPIPPVNSPNICVPPVPNPLDARRLGIPMSRSDSLSSSRSHSFRVPDLDTIESSESDGEDTPSLSMSPSSSSDLSTAFNHATRLRESVDERFSGFLLEIAAKAAEKQMREQAMAAFANDDHHEPVDHFITNEPDELEDEEKEDGQRRESFTKVNWELVAMQKHMEEKNEKKQKEPTKTAADPVKTGPWGEPIFGQPATKSPWESAKSPWGDPAANLFSQRGRQEDREMHGMQKGARPPMLGYDIVFPRCPSPEPAKFDVTQGSEALRNSMCYLTGHKQPSEPHTGLWRGACEKKEIKEPPKPKQSRKESQTRKAPSKGSSSFLWPGPESRPPSRGGLWNGFCLDTGPRPDEQTGMLTPRIEVDNPFDSPPPTPARAPPTPPPSNPDMQSHMQSIDAKLTAQQTIEEEFSDAFVTQVYNYLSLGYPSIGRNYDDELSKISRIPVEELRQDDDLAKARGYIRLGEDNNAKDAGITEETCMRWRALRVYIYEWAKQQPRMVPADRALGGFGVSARRGSWACWIAAQIQKILNNEDDIVIDFIYNIFDAGPTLDIKMLQIQLQGFLDKDAPAFCKELWGLLLDAQTSSHGIPKAIVDAKKQELKQEKVDTERAAEEERQRRENERRRQDDLDDIRQRERSDRGRMRGRGGRGGSSYSYRPGRQTHTFQLVEDVTIEEDHVRLRPSRRPGRSPAPARRRDAAAVGQTLAPAPVPQLLRGGTPRVVTTEIGSARGVL